MCELMKQSQLFTKSRKEAPADEIAKNAKLLIRAGFIHKEMAGVYSYLPLGLRVLNKINNIIRDEMNSVGSQEISMTALQSKEIWEATNRWSDDVVDNWFKTSLKNGTELGLGFTHEEAITNIMRNFVSSYKDLPFSAYQIQTKFRNESRAKSGILRGREFLMKDLYSFSANKEEHEAFYEKMKDVYMNVFGRLGIGKDTFITISSGGTFSKYSYEFQTLSEAGEDVILIDEEKNIAVNKEDINDEILEEAGMKKDSLVERKSIEVGDIYSLEYKFSKALGLKYKDKDGEDQFVYMGSYGMSPTRLMGTIVEVYSDDKGLIWPKEIAPYAVHLVEIPSANGEVRTKAGKLYSELGEKGIEVLWDDRDLRAGEKFAESDLIGIPFRVVVSEKTLASGKFEVKNRATGEVLMVAEKDFKTFDFKTF